MTNYKKYLERSRKMPQHIKNNFSLTKMSELFVQLVDKGLKNVPTAVKLKLPELTKKSDTKIKLPELKKVNV